jgi:hypothetical protein
LEYNSHGTLTMASIGPQIPDHIRQQLAIDNSDDDDGSDGDDYVPSLPPDLVAARSVPSTSSLPQPPSPPRPSRPTPNDDDGDSDSEIGPRPLPPSYSRASQDSDPVAQFMAIEEARRKNLEEASKPQKLKREEWMLVPPKSSDLLGSASF